MFYDVSLLGIDDRDGLGFNLKRHLQICANKGSYLALKQLETIENYEVGQANSLDSLWRNQFEKTKVELEEIYADLDEDVSFDLFLEEHLHDIWCQINDDLLGLIPNHLSQETFIYCFSVYEERSEDEVGPLGKPRPYSDQEPYLGYLFNKL